VAQLTQVGVPLSLAQALRELALLWLAATLASDPRRHRPSGDDPGSRCARERVMVALSGGSDGEC